MKDGSRGSTVETLADTLSNVSESLADLCQDLLLDALHGGADSVRVEKEIQKARRAVAKAEQVLRGLNQT